MMGFDMLNTYCLETWQDLGPWPSASNTASKCPTNLGGFEWKITVLDSGLPALCWSKSNSSKLPLVFRKKNRNKNHGSPTPKKYAPKLSGRFECRGHGGVHVQCGNLDTFKIPKLSVSMHVACIPRETVFKLEQFLYMQHPAFFEIKNVFWKIV